MGTQDFSKLSMQHLDRFPSGRPGRHPLAKERIPYRTLQGKMGLQPQAPFSKRIDSRMPSLPLGSSPRKRRDTENNTKVPFSSKEQRRSKSTSKLLSKNLPKDQDHRHSFYLNALSRAGLIPKWACATGVSGPERRKLRKSRMIAAEEGCGDSAMQKKTSLTMRWRGDRAKKTAKQKNIKDRKKYNLSSKGLQNTEVCGQRDDSGNSKVSPINKDNETGDTKDFIATSAKTPSNVFSPPVKVPVVKSREGNCAGGGRSKGFFCAVPENSAPIIDGRGRGGSSWQHYMISNLDPEQEPEKLDKSVEQGENDTCERQRASRRGGSSKSPHN